MARPAMTKTQAKNHIRPVVADDLYVTNVSCTVDHLDDVVAWTSDLVLRESDGKVIGHATFDEHWGDVEITWV